MTKPKNIQLIGNEIAIRWEDDSETYIATPKLRAESPSAATAGERDIFGTLHGGESNKDYSKTKVLNWEFIGGYAIRFHFSDGHKSGLYTYDLLEKLGRN